MESAASKITALQFSLQKASLDYQNLQRELDKAIDRRQHFEARLSENQQVKKEFALLLPSNAVWKMIGPVLVKQDQNEAKSNVDTRLEFIKGEVKRLEDKIKEIDSNSDKKKGEMAELRGALQEAAAQQEAGEAAIAV